MRHSIRFTAAAALLAAGAGGLWFYKRADAREAPAYRLAAVERGNLESSVSATGTLGAVTTVQVGTQVSGQVSAIYADFNSKVRKGQVIARIDPTLQQQAVEDARAGLERAQAQLEQAQGEYARNKQLYDAKVITASEFGSVQSDFAVQQANVKSARIALERANKNLGYTTITAPIDGIVVERNVDVGQTVAASLSAPQLFLIANDLSQMQILANVDESDIGLIEEGQPVRFTVQSYPNDQFTGTVKQVRLQSKTADNVVNYTAVISVANTSGKLLPGMTATVDFLTGSASDALLVPNAALRFKATAEMLATLPKRDSTSRASGATSGATSGDSTRRGAWNRNGQSGASGRGANGAASGTRTRGTGATLWVLDPTTKQAKPVRVRTGLSDGSRTAVEGKGLEPGMQVIVGTTSGETSTNASASSQSTNPLQPQTRRGPGGPRGF